MNKKVGIIVPIYNAYDYTEECIKSIIENTNLYENRLILINDKSPDERILPMLNGFKLENHNLNIEVIDNKENIGFVKTVNIGMKLHIDDDVILLNSDTEVTKDWLEKLKKCAYSNEYIATVTPLTNNGTICSVPNFGVDNELPKSITLEQYSKMIEEISLKRYPELTTGNGFCMYIKRDILNKIGYFDDIDFEKGYGEENDFCYRALDEGFIHVLCDDCFIYHKGTQSFKKENLTVSRSQVIENHLKILKEKHPIYYNKNDRFIANNPLKDIQENINLNILLFNKRRILYLINEWEENMNMTGGSSLHVKDIINSNIKNNIASFVLAPDKNDLSRFILYLYVQDFGKAIATFKTDISDYGQINFTNNIYKKILSKILDDLKIDIIHVHHFLFQTFDIIDLAKEKNIYSIITLHDLYMICPSINMIYRNIYCKYDSEKDCTKCLKNRYLVNHNILPNWQYICEKVLKKFDKIIVPSENTKKIFDETYKDLNIEVVEHGVNKVEIKEKSQIQKSDFNIAFVGAMAIHKGEKILEDLIKKNKSPEIKIHLFGKNTVTSLKKNRFDYIYHGQYKRGELPQLLIDNNIDLICIFATWPETYSYTLTEAYMAKIPVLTFDLGAVGDRVKKDDLGWVIDFPSSTEQILSKIHDIRNNLNEYNNKKANFKNYKFKTIEKMQEYYFELYKNNFKNVIEYANIYDLKDFELKTVKIDFDTYKSLYAHVVNRYEKARNSTVWKFAKILKRKIKGII